MGEAENTVESYLTSQCRLRGWWTAKFTSPGTSGVPDQCIVTPAATLFVETKRPGGKLRPLQRSVISQMKASGAIVYTINTKLRVDILIEALEHINTKHTKHTSSKHELSKYIDSLLRPKAAKKRPSSSKE